MSEEEAGCTLDLSMYQYNTNPILNMVLARMDCSSSPVHGNNNYPLLLVKRGRKSATYSNLIVLLRKFYDFVVLDMVVSQINFYLIFHSIEAQWR